MDTEPSKDLWAIVQGGAKTFMGKLDSSAGKDAVMSALTGGLPVTMSPVYELSVMHIPIRGPHGETALQKEITAAPFFLSFEEPRLHVVAEAFVFFDEMKPGDVRRYKRLIEQAEQLATRARAGDAGIVAPKQ